MFLLIPSLLLFLASGQVTTKPPTTATNTTQENPKNLEKWAPCKLAVKGQEYDTTSNPCADDMKCSVVGPSTGSSVTRRRRLRGRGGGARFGGRSGRSSRSSSKGSSSSRSSKPSYQYGKTKSQSFYGSQTQGGRSNIAGFALAGGAGYYLGSSYGYRPYYVSGYHYNSYYRSNNCDVNSNSEACRSLNDGEGRCSAEAARAEAKDCYDYCMYNDYSRSDADSYCAKECGVGSSAVKPKIWIAALAVFVLFWSM